MRGDGWRFGVTHIFNVKMASIGMCGFNLIIFPKIMVGPTAHSNFPVKLG